MKVTVEVRGLEEVKRELTRLSGAVQLQLARAPPTTWPTFLRSLALPNEVAQWSLTTLREEALVRSK